MLIISRKLSIHSVPELIYLLSLYAIAFLKLSRFAKLLWSNSNSTFFASWTYFSCTLVLFSAAKSLLVVSFDLVLYLDFFDAKVNEDLILWVAFSNRSEFVGEWKVSDRSFESFFSLAKWYINQLIRINKELIYCRDWWFQLFTLFNSFLLLFCLLNDEQKWKSIKNWDEKKSYKLESSKFCSGLAINDHFLFLICVTDKLPHCKVNIPRISLIIDYFLCLTSGWGIAGEHQSQQSERYH